MLRGRERGRGPMESDERCRLGANKTPCMNLKHTPLGFELQTL